MCLKIFQNRDLEQEQEEKEEEEEEEKKSQQQRTDTYVNYMWIWMNTFFEMRKLKEQGKKPYELMFIS